MIKYYLAVIGSFLGLGVASAYAQTAEENGAEIASVGTSIATSSFAILKEVFTNGTFLVAIISIAVLLFIVRWALRKGHGR